MVCHGCKTCDTHCDDGAYAATNYYKGQMTYLEVGEKTHVMWHAVTINFSISGVFPSWCANVSKIYNNDDSFISCFSVFFLIIKPMRWANFSKVFILEWNSTCFRQFLCPSSGVLHCTHSKPVWHIPLLCVQWKTPDDGQRNCLKHVEFHSKINLWNYSI
jgi:hypothetical protein